MSTATRVLVIDDEPSVGIVLERLLKREGYAVSIALNVKDGLNAVRERPPDMIILDLQLPDGSGESLCHDIRSTSKIQSIPILILTGNDAHGLLAKCLNGGADDYLSKPFENDELVARVHALLRRPRLYVETNTIFRKKWLELNVAERQVTVKGRPIASLAPKEFDLLYQLLLHAPKVLDKNTLALKVWGVTAEELNSRTLDVHVRKIRSKIGSAASCLKTIPAIGYQWVDP